MARCDAAFSVRSADPRSPHLAGLVMTILGQATALPFDRFQTLAHERVRRGLPIRLLSVRPMRELMKISLPEDLDLAQLAAHPRPYFQSTMTPVESPELSWRTGPGRGYSVDKANQYLSNRYKVLARSLRVTLPRLLADGRCRDLIRQLRSRGLLDRRYSTASQPSSHNGKSSDQPGEGCRRGS